MTTALATSSTSSPPRERRSGSIGRRYGRAWARVPRELGYLALTALIGLLTLHVVNGLNPGGGLTEQVALSVLLAVVLLAVSRWLGAFELLRQRWARTPPIATPAWTPLLRGKRPLRALGDVFSNGHYWLYALHALVLNPVLAVATGVVWFFWIVLGLALATFAGWGRIVPVLQQTPSRTTTGINGIVVRLDGTPFADLITAVTTGRTDGAAVVWFTIGVTAIGAGILALLPLVTRGATLAHWGLARLLLSRFTSEDLRGDVARVDAARTAAIFAEDSALRRLERDIHDGPQQRLLALQMELSTAERRLDSGTAGESIETARRLAGEALDELRALAQGFAPPLLQDRGLSAALGALGRRGDTPVDTAITIDGELPDALERSVYFVAAELVTNALKHADATRIRLEARTTNGSLLLVVSDDGRGGAERTPGRGIAGIESRLAGLGGTLEIASPINGPTTLTARVPLP